MQSSTDSSRTIEELQKSAGLTEQSLKTILENSTNVENDIITSEKNITAFSKKIDEYKTNIDSISDKANLAIEESTTAFNKNRADVEKFIEEQNTISASLFEKMETKYENTINQWRTDYSTTLAKLEELLPRALTTGLSFAYFDKKEAEVKEYSQYTKNFKWSVGGLILVSLIPFAFSITRLIEKITLETVILDIQGLSLLYFLSTYLWFGWPILQIKR